MAPALLNSQGMMTKPKFSVPKVSLKKVRLVITIASAFWAGVVFTYFVAIQMNLLPTGSAKAEQAEPAATNEADISLDDAVGLATAATEMTEEDSGPEEVNEFAQDPDDSVQGTSPVAKSSSERSYMGNLIADWTTFRSNHVEAPPVEGAPGAWEFDRESVLSDSEERLAKEFRIPELLKDRVGFWFDVYTKWSDNQRVVHHSRYPWIVFKVVDVTKIIEAETPKALWMRREKADRLVKAEANEIRQILQKLSQKKPGAELTEKEQQVASVLAPLGDDLRKQAKRALGEVRVQVGQKNFFQGGLEVSQRYLGTMENIFRRQNLPIELTRIPLVESSFNKHATSKVGATGIWQFMGNTGRKFMLVNDVIDERRSPFKASEAAARLLKENHLILRRSWPLAVTAWNHGPGGVRKACKAAGSIDLGVVVKKYRSRSFDFASSNFYSEFLAALHAERYSDVAFPPIKRQDPVDLEVVRLHKATRVKELLKVTGLSLDDFLLINPDLTTTAKRNLAVPIGFRVHVPAQVRSSIGKGIAVADTVSKIGG